jgi:hypothetical protein
MKPRVTDDQTCVRFQSKIIAASAVGCLASPEQWLMACFNLAPNFLLEQLPISVGNAGRFGSLIDYDASLIE